MKFRICILACIAALTSACGTAPSLQKAPPTGADLKAAPIVRVETTLPASHVAQYVDTEKSVLYSQNFGGGGVGLGLLLGPLGVAANMSMIEKVTMAEAEQLRGKLQITPKTLFLSAAKEAQFQVAESDTPAATRVTPLLRVSKTDETAIHLSAWLQIETGTGQQKWSAIYSHQLPGAYSISSLSQLDASSTNQISMQMSTAFRRLLDFFASDSEALANGEKAIQFKSPYMTPRFEFEQQASLIADDGQVVWLRTNSGIFVVQKPSLTYTLLKD